MAYLKSEDLIFGCLDITIVNIIMQELFDEIERHPVFRGCVFDLYLFLRTRFEVVPKFMVLIVRKFHEVPFFVVRSSRKTDGELHLSDSDFLLLVHKMAQIFCDDLKQFIVIDWRITVTNISSNVVVSGRWNFLEANQFAVQLFDVWLKPRRSWEHGSQAPQNSHHLLKNSLHHMLGLVWANHSQTRHFGYESCLRQKSHRYLGILWNHFELAAFEQAIDRCSTNFFPDIKSVEEGLLSEGHRFRHVKFAAHDAHHIVQNPFQQASNECDLDIIISVYQLKPGAWTCHFKISWQMSNPCWVFASRWRERAVKHETNVPVNDVKIFARTE